eukprot:TRINITY_DN14118_c0_g3_i3.p1 TRINITY_DN14118_c0_g3~~TRINITY_DN14118_c0_g3_i3.p1  ORF type:complete len:275 (-),score=51.81 TRINITY_DN14118_c0_g3_i3:438-1175(-)
MNHETSKDPHPGCKRKVSDTSLSNSKKRRISPDEKKRRLQEEMEQLDAQLQQIDEQISRGALSDQVPPTPNPDDYEEGEQRRTSQSRPKRNSRPPRITTPVLQDSPFKVAEHVPEFSVPAPVVSTRRRPKGVKKPVLPAPSWKRLKPYPSTKPSVAQLLNKKQEPLTYCRQILRDLMKHEYSRVFNKPVDVDKYNLTDYNEIIKHPMDLGTIDKRLKNRHYLSIHDFYKDVKLVWDNAMTYNPPG